MKPLITVVITCAISFSLPPPPHFLFSCSSNSPTSLSITRLVFAWVWGWFTMRYELKLHTLFPVIQCHGSCGYSTAPHRRRTGFDSDIPCEICDGQSVTATFTASAPSPLWSSPSNAIRLHSLHPLATAYQFLIPIITSSSTSSVHLSYGLPLILTPFCQSLCVLTFFRSAAFHYVHTIFIYATSHTLPCLPSLVIPTLGKMAFGQGFIPVFQFSQSITPRAHYTKIRRKPSNING